MIAEKDAINTTPLRNSGVIVEILNLERGSPAERSRKEASPK